MVEAGGLPCVEDTWVRCSAGGGGTMGTQCLTVEWDASWWLGSEGLV